MKNCESNKKLDGSDLLRFARTSRTKFETRAVHIEIDISRQVLFIVDLSGAVARILLVSSVTRSGISIKVSGRSQRGRFRSLRKINGVRDASLGKLYYPNYFGSGVAIHGSNSVPTFPASHGCVRIPRFADRAFFQMTKIGMEVFVYD